MRNVAIGALASLFLTGTALAEDLAAIEVNYRCDGGVDLPVVFLNNLSPDQLAVALIEGRLVTMRQAVSGSGIRYVAVGDAAPFVLRGKGDDATLYRGEDEAEEVLTGCKARE
ncbi:MliC family protein [Paracoccus sp. TK19116]|uniref:MliC family protein n=1 Tax=Paracoccus albicereus TaxID=2922394 RepID=A0ABT1MRZ2_9RHOB|nr:MliC family protein [Paracoccus albicereus]MCQ0970914.1 MliC family protein [Paracoccus albicereus]